MPENRTDEEAATQALESALRALLLRPATAPPEVVRAAQAAFKDHGHGRVVPKPSSVA
ncbi:MAG TPA: hypothetical protein VM264_02070 [Acidimicrobiales bacterium]|nr:hypothetical protein [Acidimicrobiales bacterium]